MRKLSASLHEYECGVRLRGVMREGQARTAAELGVSAPIASTEAAGLKLLAGGLQLARRAIDSFDVASSATAQPDEVYGMQYAPLPVPDLAAAQALQDYERRSSFQHEVPPISQPTNK